MRITFSYVARANPFAQKSQASSAVIGCAVASSAAPLDWAMNMTVCIVIAAMRRGLTSGAARPAASAFSISSVNSASSGACAILTSAGWEISSCGREIGEQWALRVGVGRQSSNSSSTATLS